MNEKKFLNDNGKIANEAIEINVVHHCNLACNSCSHASPNLNRYFADPSDVYKDLCCLKSIYSPEHIRLVGGEPLLHPQFLDLLLAIREANISQKLRLITNGVLLSKMKEEIWTQLNEIHISIYPGFEFQHSLLEKFIQLAHKHNITLKLLYFSNFRKAYTNIKRDNNQLTKRIYLTCQIAQRWKCHTLFEGFFYKCPQSLFLPMIFNSQLNNIDKIKLSNQPSFQDELISFIQSPTPLDTCKLCLGSVGLLNKHQQRDKSSYMDNRKKETEIDFSYLSTLEKEPDAVNSCCIDEKFLNLAY